MKRGVERFDELPEDHERIRPIPQRRVVEKLDEYMSRRDYPAVERHLLYWLEEARLGNDLRGMLLVRNEQIGHYRKTGEREKALEAVDAALELVDRQGFQGTLSAGTTYVNAATCLSAFGQQERALALFGQARPLYEARAQARPDLLGGLYNNMALACAALARYDEAEALYGRALEQMARRPNGALEQAVTCLNLADLAQARDGAEAAEGRIFELLERAEALLDAKGVPHDGYYAFVCEKCAPTFDYYGWFARAEQLRREAKDIYERA